LCHVGGTSHIIHKIYCLGRVTHINDRQINEKNIIVDLSSGLLSDYEKLYKSSKYADISIYVGKEPNNKIFLAHTLVLCTRNPFFENNLTGSTETSKEIQKVAMTFEDVSPDVFEILLR